MTGTPKLVYRLALIAVCLVLLAPLTLAEVPPLLDYPNHLARMVLLAFGAADPILSRFYATRWAIIPNLALDVTLPPLMRVLPVHVAGRSIVGLIVLLPVLGAAAYHRALTGRRSLVPLTAALFAWNAAMLRGFLTFEASVGLALLFAAAWIAWRDTKPVRAFVTASLGSVVLFFCHLTGALFFAILLGTHEVTSPRFRARPWSIGLLAAVFLAPAILYAVSDLSHMQGDAVFRSSSSKALAAMMPVINYHWSLDLLTSAICVAVPAWCLARRWASVPPGAVLALAAAVLLFLVSPVAFKGTFDLDTRFIVMTAALLPAVLVPAAIPRRAAWCLTIGFLALFGARMGVLAGVWNAWRGDLADFRAVIAPVQPGDLVLSAQVSPREAPGWWASGPNARRLSDGRAMDTHLPALLLIERRAWWPYLFDNPSQQPIETREPYRSLAERVGPMPDMRELIVLEDAELGNFTHVLLLDAGGLSGPVSPRLVLMVLRDKAALFRVVADRPNAGPSR